MVAADVKDEISNILEFDTAGDPITGRTGTRMTPEKIGHCLQERLGIIVSATTIRRLLAELDYPLKGYKYLNSCV